MMKYLKFKSLVKVISLTGVVVLLLSSLSVSAYYQTPDFESSFGSSGTGNGQFDVVAGIATNPSSGKLYAADRHNARVQVFSAEGNYESQFTTNPGPNGAFFPVDIVVNNDGSRIFVADLINQTIRVFDQDQVEIDQIGSSGSGAGQFEGYPMGLALNSDSSQLIVYETGPHPTYEHQIHVFDSTDSSMGDPINDWATGTSGSTQYVHPAGLAISPDDSTLYIADSDSSNIQLFDLSGNPKPTPTFGGPGAGEGQFSQISGIAISPDQSTLFVSDSENGRVQMFRLSDLSFLGEFSTLGDLPEGSSYIVGGLAFSTDGTKLFVGDNANRRISIYNLVEYVEDEEPVDQEPQPGGIAGNSLTPKPPRTGALLGAGLITVSLLVLILLVAQEISSKHLDKEHSKNKFH